MKKLFTEHPATIGETYGEHFVQASGFAGKMFMASIACFIHALVPCLCIKTGSHAIRDLNERMISKRHMQKPQRKDKVPAS